MEDKKRDGFTLQSAENRAESAERGSQKGSWMRSSAWRVSKSPPPPLNIKKTKPKDE